MIDEYEFDFSDGRHIFLKIYDYVNPLDPYMLENPGFLLYDVIIDRKEVSKGNLYFINPKEFDNMCPVDWDRHLFNLEGIVTCQYG